MVAQIPRILNETGQHAELRTMLERSIREHSATSEMLIWLCGEKKNWGDLITPDLLWAILAALEREQHSSTGRASRLLKALVDDRELLGEIFKKVDVGLARDAMRRLQVTPLFDELTKRSLLARMVKVYPELETMIAGAETQEKAAPLIVSWSSLEKRRAEHEEIVKVKIPENTKEIAIARSYGDLSENFEFKAAKQMQSVLMRRKADLEQMLHDARGTSFENPDTSRVSIGTIVTLRNAETNNEETYTILGAWDGDPDRHIISYQTAIGQALLGHEVGETISLNTEDERCPIHASSQSSRHRQTKLRRRLSFRANPPSKRRSPSRSACSVLSTNTLSAVNCRRLHSQNDWSERNWLAAVTARERKLCRSEVAFRPNEHQYRFEDDHRARSNRFPESFLSAAYRLQRADQAKIECHARSFETISQKCRDKNFSDHTAGTASTLLNDWQFVRENTQA